MTLAPYYTIYKAIVTLFFVESVCREYLDVESICIIPYFENKKIKKKVF